MNLNFEKVPSLFLYINDFCNLSCAHCSHNAKSRRSKSKTLMTLEMVDKIIEFGKKYRCDRVGISGGEPTLHPQFLEIAKKFRGSGMVVNIISNGIYIAEKGASALEETIKSVTISLDGFEESHNFLRRVKLFEKTMNAIRGVAKSKIELRIQCTLIQKNYSTLDGFVEFLVGYAPRKIIISPLIYRGRARWLKEQFLPAEFMDQIAEKAILFNLEHTNCRMETSIYPKRAILTNRHEFNMYNLEDAARGYPAFSTLLFMANGDILPNHSSTPPYFRVGNLLDGGSVEEQIRKYTNSQRHIELLSVYADIERYLEVCEEKSVHWITLFNQYVERRMAGLQQ